jgi:hypothetical protein
MSERDLYEKALAEIRQAEERIDRLRVFVKTYEELAGEGAAPAEASGPSEPSPPPKAACSWVSRPLTPPPPRERGRVPPANRAPAIPADVFEAAVLDLFRDVGRPMLRHEILEELMNRGLRFGGDKPINTLSTKLYRASRVVGVLPGHGYWPVGWPLPTEQEPRAAAAAEDGTEGAGEPELWESRSGHQGNGTAALN